MYGQVASGGNWKGKPVSVEIAGFQDWFHTKPGEHIVPAIFIPFTQHHGQPEPVSDDDSWADVLLDRCRANERDYGLMFDRLRIAELFHGGPILLDANVWVDGAISEAKEAA